MTARSLKKFLLCCLVISFIGVASAEDIYVKNKLFKGLVYGQGTDTEIGIQELGKALGLKVASENGRWRIGDMIVPGRKQDDTVVVFVSDLKKAGLMVRHNPELDTIDITMPKGQRTSSGESSGDRTSAAAQNWGSSNKPTLVYFGASWCGPCRTTKPGLSRFESESDFNVIHVDIDQKSSPTFTQYRSYFEGNSIPYFAVLDASGRKVHAFVGGQTYKTLKQQTEKYK